MNPPSPPLICDVPKVVFVPVYFENARYTTTSTLTFTIVTGGTWKIKISQIECSSTSRAYPDCDQYVTGATGTISSYNWANVQLQAKDYQHCIRREEGIKKISYLILHQDSCFLRKLLHTAFIRITLSRFSL